MNLLYSQRLCVAILFWCGLSGTAYCQPAGWIALGPTDLGKPSYARVDNDAIATFGSEPYLIYSDYSAGGAATVVRHTPTGWQTLGTRGISSGFTRFNDIATDGTGNVYVAFCDAGIGQKASVRKYNGTSWSTLGASGLSTGHALRVNVAVTATGTPYVSYIDTALGYLPVVKKWDGTNWIDLGANGVVDPVGAYYSTLTLDNAGNPVLAYSQLNTGALNVRSWNGTTWAAVGNTNFAPGATNIRLAIKKNGVPYVLYRDGTLNAMVMMRLNSGSTTWTTVGQPFNAGGVAGGDIAFDQNDTLYETHCDPPNSSALVMRRYSDTSFVNIGTISYNQLASIHLAIDGSNTPYIAMVPPTSLGGGAQEIVITYNGTGWVELAPLGILGKMSGGSAMAIDSKGQPYAFLAGRGVTEKAMVKMYNGSQWVNVGAGDITGPWLAGMSIALNAQDVPYVVYGERFQQLKVKKFNGTAWVLVGDSSQLVGGDYPDIAIDHAGTPYICFADPVYGGKPTVMKFDGTNWVTVGTRGFEVNRVYNTSIVIDKSGTPFVVYQNTLGNLDISVRKFNGLSWVYVGAPGITSTEAAYPDIALDTAGLPYVIYSCVYAGTKANVTRFDGSNWVSLGAPISAGMARACAIAIDSDNTVYAAYTDRGDNDETWVRSASVNAPNWVTLGSSPVSDGLSYVTGLGVKHAQPVVMWGSFGQYVKKYTAPQANSISYVPSNVLDFSLSPNPTTNNIRANIKVKTAERTAIVIQDLSGRELFRQEVPVAGNAVLNLPTSGYAPGIYLVTVCSSNSTKTMRFVKK